MNNFSFSEQRKGEIEIAFCIRDAQWVQNSSTCSPLRAVQSSRIYSGNILIMNSIMNSPSRIKLGRFHRKIIQKPLPVVASIAGSRGPLATKLKTDARNRFADLGVRAHWLLDSVRHDWVQGCRHTLAEWCSHLLYRGWAGGRDLIPQAAVAGLPLKRHAREKRHAGVDVVVDNDLALRVMLSV